MKIELIGHGLNNKLKTTEHYLKRSFKDSKYDSFIGFSAYTKKNGLNLISKELLEAKERFKSIKLYLGIAEEGTSKEALDFLIENEIETWTFCSFSDYIFHPKIYFFGGEFDKRIIIGSSNLTKKGLGQNGNIEASVLIDYTISDTSGLKLQRQYFEYFDEIINGTNLCVKPLTIELLEEFISKGYVIEENRTHENDNSTHQKRNQSGKPRRKNIFEIEKQEKSNLPKSEKESNKAKLEITDRYLETWDLNFDLFVKFKSETGNVTVPHDHPINALYRWYRLQKIFFADKTIDNEYELKYIHFSKLEMAGFYFGDAHKLLQQNVEDEWLDILKDALDEKEKIQVNHRYKYKRQQTLGTWLVGVSQATKGDNPNPRKLKLKKKIEALGFDFTKTSRKPEHSASRFLEQLLEDKAPIKVEYQKLFNRQMLPRSAKIPEKLKQEINVVWELQFNEQRSWDKNPRDKDRTEEWKAFRYNIMINPAGKWYYGQSVLGDLYNWVYHKRNDKKKMDLVIDKFSEKEIIELRNEGFPV